MGTELWQYTATGLAEMIRQKEASPSEILASVHGRIDQIDPSIHAFVTRVDEAAISEAKAADRRAMAGELIGPMDGIPYSIKDLCDTAGIRTTMGSRFFADNVPERDSVTAERLRGSGGVLLGKTNTPQAGYKDMCDNLVAETTVNPWSLERTSGGSSGGAGAAVAAGFGPLAQGGDGAGSIRIPAALCGVVGFKPSWGRVPLFPYREFWSHRTHWGPITRSVADAAVMIQILAGPDQRDAGSIDNRIERFQPLPRVDEPLRGVKIRWSPDMGYGPVDPEVAAIVKSAVDRLADMGCLVEEAPPGWEDPAEWHRIIWSTSMAGSFRDRAKAHPDWIEPTLQSLIDEGLTYSAVDLRMAEAARGVLYTQSVGMFSTVDFFVSPAMPITAWSAEPGRGPTQIEGRKVHPESLGRAYHLYPFNLTGQPAISIPCGHTKDGLPVGIQIAGGWHEDAQVLRIAESLENRLAIEQPFPLS